MAGPDDDENVPTRIEEVPAFARDATEQEDVEDSDVFSDAGGAEAVASPPPAKTDVGEMPTELRPMNPEDMRQLEDAAETQDVARTEDGPGDVTRADPVEDISLGSLDDDDDDDDVFSDSDEG